MSKELATNINNTEKEGNQKKLDSESKMKFKQLENQMKSKKMRESEGRRVTHVRYWYMCYCRIVCFVLLHMEDISLA